MPHLFYSLVVLACLLLVSPARAGDAKADAELKRLAERAAAATGDAEALRQEVQTFRQTYPGTTHAVQAAGLLRDLPSPLDKYDPKNIHPLEKFSWQPPELVAIFGEHRGRQGGAVTAVLYSRNGKMLVSGSTNGFVRLWDPATMRLQHVLGHSHGSFALAFSKDNTLLASGGGDGHVRLWDVSGEAPKDTAQLKVASTPLYAVAIAPDKKTVAAGGADTRLGLWELGEMPREAATGDTHTGPIHALAYSLDGKTLATGSADKTLRLWTIGKENRLKEKVSLEAHAGAVLALAFHPTDEKTLVTGGGDGTIRFWNIAGAKPIIKTTLKIAGGAVYAVAFSQSGKTLATAHADGTGRTWSVGAPGGEKTILEGHINQASGIGFSPDGTTVVTGSHDWTVRQWPAIAGLKPKDKTVTKGHLSHVYSMSFAPDGKSMASGAYDRSIRLWDQVQPEAKERLPNSKVDGPVYAVCFGPDGKSYAGSGTGSTFRTYEAATRRFIYTFPGHQGNISGLAFSPEGNLIASCSNDKSIRLWNPKTGKDVFLFSDFEAFVNSVAFAPDAKHLLATSGYYLYDKNGRHVLKDGVYIYQDSTVRLYNLADKKEVFRWENDRVLPQGIAFAPDGKHFIAGGTDYLLRQWSWPNPPKEPAILYKSSYAMSHLSYSPDGRFIAAHADAAFVILDAATGKKLKHWPLREHYGNIAFAPDSRHVTVSMGTGVIYLLRIEEGKRAR